MKTIQQRADDYVGHPEDIDEFSYATIKRQAFIDGAKTQWEIDIEEKSSTARKFYFAGAKDQKKIDIEKACEWLMANLEIPEDGAISEEEGKELLGDKPVTFIEEFRKAMEEQL